MASGASRGDRVLTSDFEDLSARVHIYSATVGTTLSLVYADKKIVAIKPRERYLELAPAFWSKTRARLNATELADEVGAVTVPPATDSIKESPAD